VKERTQRTKRLKYHHERKENERKLKYGGPSIQQEITTLFGKDMDREIISQK